MDTFVLSAPPSSNPELLTGEGGPHDIGPEMRNFLVVFDDGRVFVSAILDEEPELQARVDEILENIRATGRTLKPAERQPAGRLAIFYQSFTRTGTEEHEARASVPATARSSALVHFQDGTAGAEVIALLEKTRGKNVNDVILTNPNEPGAPGQVEFVINGDAEPIDHQPSAAVVQRYIDGLWALAGTPRDDGGVGYVSAPTMHEERYPSFVHHGSPLPSHLSSIRGQILSGTGRAKRVAVRLVSAMTRLPTLEELRYTTTDIKLLQALIRRTKGGIWVGGEVGHGKTSLIYTLLATAYELRLRHGRRPLVYTIEAPPERLTPFAYHIDVTADGGGLAAAEALLRSYASMLLLGEARTEEEVMVGFRAMISSLSLFGTTHAPNNVGIHTKFKQMGIPPYMFDNPSLFNAYISQVLVPKLCPHCSQFYEDRGDDHVAQVVADIGLLGRAKFRGQTKPGVCPAECHRGVIGRVPLAEIMPIDQARLRLLNESVVDAELEWRNRGGRSISEKALEMVIAGDVAPFDAMMAIDLEQAAHNHHQLLARAA